VDREVVRDFTGNDVTGSYITVSVREIIFRDWKKERLTFEFDWTKERVSTNGQA
jgi:hypothetical protein